MLHQADDIRPVHILIGRQRRQGAVGTGISIYFIGCTYICGFVRHQKSLYILYSKTFLKLAVFECIKLFVGGDEEHHSRSLGHMPYLADFAVGRAQLRQYGAVFLFVKRGQNLEIPHFIVSPDINAPGILIVHH